MSKSAASEEKLGALHNALADNLLHRITHGEEVFDSKSGEFVFYKGGTTATLSVIRAFINDNDITCVADEANKLGELRKKLTERRNGAKVLNLSDHLPKANSGG